MGVSANSLNLSINGAINTFNFIHDIFGALHEKTSAEFLYGPVVALSRIDNALRMIEDQVSNMDKSKLEGFQRVIQGKEKADVEGADVFRYLKEAVLKQPSD